MRSARTMAHTRTAEGPPHPSFLKRWKKPLTVVFFLVLIVLFTLLARRIDWSEVLDTLGDFKLRTLLIAGGHHQLCVQPQPERVGRWHRHALSVVFPTRGEQREHREDPRLEPGHQL